MGTLGSKGKKDTDKENRSDESGEDQTPVETPVQVTTEKTEVIPATKVPEPTRQKSTKSPMTETTTPIDLPSLGNLEGPYDINPSNAALMKRWKANKEFRESGMEAELAKLVLGSNWESRYHLMLTGRCPLAFPDEETFLEFLTELLSILSAQNLSGWVAIRGSSTTFLSIHPEKGSDPDVKSARLEFQKDKNLTNTKRNLHYFDCKIVNAGGETQAQKNYNPYQLIEMYSDIDLNIKSQELIHRLKKSGAHVSSAEVGGNYNQDATMDAIPELWELKANWGERLQRDISFVGVTSVSDSHKYSKHPFTFSIQ